MLALFVSRCAVQSSGLRFLQHQQCRPPRPPLPQFLQPLRLLHFTRESSPRHLYLFPVHKERRFSERACWPVRWRTSFLCPSSSSLSQVYMLLYSIPLLRFTLTQPVALTLHPSVEPSFCALSSLAMVLNALNFDPKKTWKGVWRWVSEETLQCESREICGHSLEKVKQHGMTFTDFSALAKCHRVSISRIYFTQFPFFSHMKSV
jgi:hypothetical protein